MRRIRAFDVCTLLLLLAGLALAANAWSAGSLLRYRLAGYGLGALLALPFGTLLWFGEAARRGWRRLAFAGVPLLGALLLGELGFRILGPAPVPPEVLREDPRLGHVLAPGSGGTDGRGFRNAATKDRVDLLCVGDSQTWGFHVDLADTFPAVLGRELGVEAGQMANGAYGPVQYRELVRQGLPLQPRAVVVGFYFGNDLLDAVDFAGLPGAADLRAPDRTYRAPRNPELDGLPSPNWTMALIDAVLARSRLLGAAAAAAKSRLQGGALDDQPGALRFPDPRIGTVLLPAYRLSTVDPASSTVQDGLRITGLCLRDVAGQCRAAGARCVVLAIPTKEYAYAEWLRSRGTPHDGLAALHAAESAARAAVFAAARAAGCELADLAPACVTALAAGQSPWPPGSDGHLNRHGHALAAQALVPLLRQR